MVYTGTLPDDNANQQRQAPLIQQQFAVYLNMADQYPHSACRRHCWCATILLGIFFASGFSQANEAPASGLIIRHPVSADKVYGSRDEYCIELLKLAIRKSGIHHEFEAVEVPTMSESRSIKSLQHGRYDVHWMMTDRDREGDALPVRVPLYKGLIGWRLLLIQKHQQQQFNRIATEELLSQKVAVQGLDWPDSVVLEANGFELRKSIHWDNMIALLQRGQVDYFPRGVLEIWTELDNLGSTTLAVEQNLVIHYPTAYYFFVNDANPALARELQKGLDAAIADGSFDQLFNRYFGDYLLRARLDRRRAISLTNPQLPEQTPLKKARYWYIPGSGALPSGIFQNTQTPAAPLN